MDPAIDESPYSQSFRVLTYMGAWVIDPSDPIKLWAYSAYKVVMTIAAFMGLVSLTVDFYMVFGDFKKMTWNLCISTLFYGAMCKNLYTIKTCNQINSMRGKLHRDYMTSTGERYDAIHQQALKQLKIIHRLFYGIALIFVPTWLGAHYWPRQLPIPLRLPFEINTEDDLEFNIAFLLFALGGIAGVFLVAHTEICMFTILIQISREYRIFLKDIPLLDNMYQDNDALVEVNPWLRRLKTKMLLRKISIRQQRLIGYIEEFESSYSVTLLLQAFVMSVLVIVSVMQCILESSISGSLSYQLGYLFILVADMFLVCWFSTEIRDQCSRVAVEVYSIQWYRMAIDIQKDIRMMIMRAQRPPKITSGKMMELNLHAFMSILKNIYSWLALFNQLEGKLN